MKFIPGVLAGKVSGSLGGMTAAHNRGGYYLRNRVVPTNPNTVRQQEVRSAFGALVALWAGLTEVARARWEDYAANRPTVNTLGEALTLTGQQIYIASNAPRLQAGLTRVDVAPIIFAGPPAPGGVAVVDALATPGSAGTFALTDPQPPGDDGDLLVYISRPLPAATNFFKGPYRLWGATPITTLGVVTDLSDAMPQAIQSTQIVAVRYRVTCDDGRLGGVTDSLVTVTESA